MTNTTAAKSSTALRSLDALRSNPEWAKLPLLDRSKWQRVRFGDVVENLNETERDPAEAGIERFIAMEHLGPGSLHIREWGNVADGTTFNRRCRPGQVLFGKRRAYQRKVAVAEFDAVVSGDIYVFAPKGERLLPELLPFLCILERFFNFAVETSAGSLSPRTNWSSIAGFEFDIPPPAQQRRIAEILWAIDKAMEAWFELKNESKAATGTYALSAFHGTAVAEAGAYGVTRRLGDIFEVRTGGTPSRAQPDYWDGQIPWIKTGEVNYADIYDSEEKISTLGYEHSAVKMIPPDSVLMAMYGQGPTLGRVAQLRVEATVNQACAAIFPTPKINMRYLYYYLVHQYSNIRKLARGASQPNINALIAKDFIVPTPALEEQSAVVDTFEGLDRAQCEIDIHIADTKKLLFDLINCIRA